LDRDDLTLVVAATLGLAMALGWLLASVAGRLNARRTPEMSVTQAAGRHAAETAQRPGQVPPADVEADLRARLAEAEAGRAEALAQLQIERAAADEMRAAWRDVVHSRGS